MAQESQQVEELPLEGAGARLKAAREAQGLSVADISATTKVPERHLEAIERSDFAALPARTYAIGFSRAYARAVDLDEDSILDQVRAELSKLETPPPRVNQAFEPGDPARVPGQRLAWLSALAVLALIVALFFAWRSFYQPAASLPPIAEKTQPQSVTARQPVAPTPAPAAAAGPVVVTAQGERVWVRIDDASGNQLFQKEMIRGESFTVPAGAQGARLTTAKPQELAVTIAGRPLAALEGAVGFVGNVPLEAAPSPAAAPESTVPR